MAMLTINPATGETLKSYDETPADSIDALIEQTQQSYLGWRKTSFAVRSEKMKKAASLLRDRKDEYAKLMALEMGKPLKQGLGEVEKCALVCEYYADYAEEHLAPDMIETEATKSYAAYEPQGILLAVMPWNFPMWQVFRAAAPSLMAGNALILKHASNVQGSAEAMETIFREAGFPEGLFLNLRISSKLVAGVIENPHVKAVTLTGSTPAGKAVAAKSGEMLKKTVLELGGSDPYVVLADADVKAAAESCATSRMINTGQSCVAAKRFVVVESIADEFEKLFVEHLKQHKMGDPLEEGVTVGPMAREDLRDELHDQVVRSVKAGAKVLLGGEVPERKGAFYPPTVLSGIKKGMPVYTEETFGPVASIIRVKDDDEAIRVANDSVFGLGAAVFTRDVARGEKIAKEELEAGCCFVNTFVKSDSRLPFGGIKESGYGRELGVYGIREFVNTKTVYVK